MKRDWDVIREILLAVEALPHGQNLTSKNFDEDRWDEIAHHLELLEDAGLISGTKVKSLGAGAPSIFARRLTWDGHELLDAIRQESVWRNTRSTIQEFGGGMTFEVVKQLAVGLIKNQIGI